MELSELYLGPRNVAGRAGKVENPFRLAAHASVGSPQRASIQGIAIQGRTLPDPGSEPQLLPRPEPFQKDEFPGFVPAFRPGCLRAISAAVEPREFLPVQ
jgi:hypothetical protein